MTTTAMMFPTNTKDQRRLFLPRLLPLLLLLSLLPTTCWSFECFAASDGYVYPGAGTPTVDVDSVLGKAVRAYLDPNTTISQPVQEKYGTILNDWCVGDVVAMDSIFYYLSSFDEDIDNWNVSSVTTMRGMFFAARSFNRDIGKWDVSKVTNMRQMFRVATSFNRDIGTWNVGQVTDMNEMFFDAEAFNQSSIADWNVSRVTDMGSMFEQAQSFGQNLCPWVNRLPGGYNNATSTVVVDNMFLGTACTEPADPWLLGDKDTTNDVVVYDGSFCVYACDGGAAPTPTPASAAAPVVLTTLPLAWLLLLLMMMSWLSLELAGRVRQ